MVVNWKFDRKRAVRVVLEQDPLSFRFEREVNAALLAVYAFWPVRRRLLAAARILARLITFGEISETGTIGIDLLSDLDLIKGRLGEPWYTDFHEYFVKPLGGLSAVVEARSSRSLERQIQKERQNSSVRVCCDLVRFLLNMSQHNPKLATRGKAIRYVSENIFGVTDHYGVQIPRKRKQLYQSDDPANHRAIGKQKVDKDWDESPCTSVLLYAIENTLPMPPRSTNRTEGLPSLQVFLTGAKEVAAALRLYERTMRCLEGLRPSTNAIRSWRMFRVEGTLDEVTIPTFGSEDLQRLRVIRLR